MKIRPLLKKKDTGYLVYVALYEGDSTEIISTGQYVKQSEWSKKDNSPKDQRSPAAKAIERVKSELHKVILRMEADDIVPTPVTTKERYRIWKSEQRDTLSTADKAAKAASSTIVSMAEWWQENGLYRHRASTQKVLKSSLNIFINYLKNHKLGNLERKALSTGIIKSYERYLLRELKATDNTHGKLMKHLRLFLKDIDFDTSFFEIRSEPVLKVSLTVEELRLLENVDVSKFVEWQKAKDTFLIGCYTGLRISDIKQLNPVNTAGGFIQKKLLKNGKWVKIPIIKACDDILKRYDYKYPGMPEQKVNQFIKKVAEEAKIDTPLMRTRTKGGEVENEIFPKYKLITTHVASKSFITLAPQLWNLTPAEIAHIIGKDLRTMLTHYFNDQSEIGRQKMIEADHRSTMKAV